MTGTVLCALLVGGAAGAQADGLPGKDRRDFWDWVLAPHRAEVELILGKVRENRAMLAHPYGDVSPFDPNTGWFTPQRASERERLLDETEGMLRYALRLAPGDIAVERELAMVLDDGERPAAQAALERYLRDEVPERVASEARVRLARWYARQGRDGDAIVQLRLALGQGVDSATRTTALVLLASVYMNGGRLAEAIDLLSNGIAGPYGAPYPSSLPVFALAVAYDRDEQVTLAHQTVERMLQAGSRPDALYYALHDEGGVRNPMVPSYERHYFAALQLELMGHLPEARIEWLAYARTPGAPYARRARQHLAEVDRMMRERRRAPRARAPKASAPSPVPQPPGWLGP